MLDNICCALICSNVSLSGAVVCGPYLVGISSSALCACMRRGRPKTFRTEKVAATDLFHRALLKEALSSGECFAELYESGLRRTAQVGLSRRVGALHAYWTCNPEYLQFSSKYPRTNR